MFSKNSTVHVFANEPSQEITSKSSFRAAISTSGDKKSTIQFVSWSHLKKGKKELKSERRKMCWDLMKMSSWFSV